MSYRLDTGLPLADAVRRVADEQTGRAMAAIRDHDRPVGGRVHELRKCVKKVRALLRLARAGFPEFRKVNRSYRDVARRLASHRDARVMYDLAVDLVDEQASLPLLRWFEARVSLAEELALPALEEAHDAFAALQSGIDDWVLDELGPGHVMHGLSRTLRVVHKRSDRITGNSGDKKAHEWRKRVKDHWYHLRLLRDVLEKEDRERLKRFGELGELIGDAHDRWVLAGEINALPDYLRRAPGTERVREAARNERLRLQSNAVSLAESLLRAPRGEFLGRVGRSWHGGGGGSGDRTDPAGLRPAAVSPRS